VRTLWQTAKELREKWAGPAQRAEIIEELEERGIGFTQAHTKTKAQAFSPGLCGVN
jgi:hypothetical protein